jgi:hypothetical protein
MCLTRYEPTLTRTNGTGAFRQLGSSNVTDQIVRRCVQLAWPMAKDNPVAWAELLSKVKDGLLSAFDAAVSQRDDEVRRSESQQSMPGWNFCTFFILKVCSPQPMFSKASHISSFPGKSCRVVRGDEPLRRRFTLLR